MHLQTLECNPPSTKYRQDRYSDQRSDGKLPYHVGQRINRNTHHPFLYPEEVFHPTLARFRQLIECRHERLRRRCSVPPTNWGSDPTPDSVVPQGSGRVRQRGRKFRTRNYHGPASLTDLRSTTIYQSQRFDFGSISASAAKR